MVITRCLSISSMPISASPALLRRHVAVIGAGAAGLVAARELHREGHSVAVFERGTRVGGTWIYSTETESDPLGLDPNRSLVHTSLYDSLRTNLPKECMGFFDYPFVAVDDGREGDSRRFPSHHEVLRYLEDFARDFGVLEVVRFRTEVVRVEMEEEGKWAVTWRRVAAGEDGGGEITGGGEDQVEEIYDGVVVCNGHYTEPRLAAIPGIDIWPGKQMHSHNYRVPEPFHEQVVVIIGTAASAADISKEIAQFAKEVHVASRSDTEGTPKRQPGYDNLWLHSMIESTHEDGTVVFQDGSSTHVDVIMHCTGYKYHFPFLQTNGIVTMDDNRVGPLYKHIFPPALAPYLSFIGIPWKVVPFPLVELQSKWVAAVLSGRVSLPTQKEMMEDVEAFYKELETVGYPKRYTHNMTNYQYEYIDWLANECGYPPSEDWRKLMYKATSKNRKERPESYRDEWDDDHLVAQAHESFKRFFK